LNTDQSYPRQASANRVRRADELIINPQDVSSSCASIARPLERERLRTIRTSIADWNHVPAVRMLPQKTKKKGPDRCEQNNGQQKEQPARPIRGEKDCAD
jgi:hypothetical protein